MITKLALVGIGNSALSLMRALELAYRGELKYAPTDAYPASILAGIAVADIEVVSGYDVDVRKVGLPLGNAAESPPNFVGWRQELRLSPDRFAARVRQGRVLDGAPPHLCGDGLDQYHVEVDPPLVHAEVAAEFLEAGADVVVLYLPTGSQEAVEFYAAAALKAECGLVVCMPGRIAGSQQWAERFRSACLPIIGDDVKSQLGTTALHEALFRLLRERGMDSIYTYQLSVGGNADHLNLSNKVRQAIKARSKESGLKKQATPADHVGPTANHYLDWTHDQKRSYLFFRSRGVLGQEVQIDVTLQVSDSPNSATVVLDAVRVASAARRIGFGGALLDGAERFMKTVPSHQVGFSISQVQPSR
jgi:myo-inositol-1-phosphate synthase